MSDPKANVTEAQPEILPLDFIVKNIPLFTGYLLFLGLSNSLGFYSFFKIRIFSYISLGESLLFSMDYFIILSIYFLTIFSLVRIDFIDGQKEGFNKLAFVIGLGSVLVVIGALLYINAFRRDTKFWWRICDLYLIDFFILSIFVILYKRNKKARLWLGQFKTYLIVGIFLLTVGIYSFTILTALRTKYLPCPKITTITMKDHEVVKTSDSLIFVGKSEKYIFLFNRTFGSAEIISNDEVKNIKWLRNDKKEVTRHPVSTLGNFLFKLLEEK